MGISLCDWIGSVLFLLSSRRPIGFTSIWPSTVVCMRFENRMLKFFRSSLRMTLSASHADGGPIPDEDAFSVITEPMLKSVAALSDYIK